MLNLNFICRHSMKKKEDDKSGLSQSFVTGVIAVVFLIVGYQTAVFIHRAALLKIAADRDSPDTVFVYMSPPGTDAVSAGQSLPSGHAAGQQRHIVRRNASHSPHVEAVRRTLPHPRVESFRFDPNTVSVEDLCRLGFTLKQAQSIENYRSKGGRFRRKEDFAKSFVVSDSIYRRLESFIDIPLIDLNLADSAAFDALPGIGGWFASRMVAHRKSLGGYSSTEQLMDIHRFDRQKYDALKDLVTVSQPYRYPFWELSADSLRLHPYIRNYETAKAIVLFREHNPREAWTMENLSSAGIITHETVAKLSVCVK